MTTGAKRMNRMIAISVTLASLLLTLGLAPEVKINAGDPDTDDLFGYSVSISGDYAVAGAYANNDAGGNSGSVYAFNLSSGSWSQQAKLTASDAAAKDELGLAR